jgi:hypothetical protein
MIRKGLGRTAERTIRTSEPTIRTSEPTFRTSEPTARPPIPLRLRAMTGRHGRLRWRDGGSQARTSLTLRPCSRTGHAMVAQRTPVPARAGVSGRSDSDPGLGCRSERTPVQTRAGPGRAGGRGQAAQGPVPRPGWAGQRTVQVRACRPWQGRFESGAVLVEAARTRVGRGARATGAVGIETGAAMDSESPGGGSPAVGQGGAGVESRRTVRTSSLGLATTRELPLPRPRLSGARRPASLGTRAPASPAGGSRGGRLAQPRSLAWPGGRPSASAERRARARGAGVAGRSAGRPLLSESRRRRRGGTGGGLRY